jgi:hypothetical protein
MAGGVGSNLLPTQLPCYCSSRPKSYRPFRRFHEGIAPEDNAFVDYNLQERISNKEALCPGRCDSSWWIYWRSHQRIGHKAFQTESCLRQAMRKSNDGRSSSYSFFLSLVSISDNKIILNFKINRIIPLTNHMWYEDIRNYIIPGEIFKENWKLSPYLKNHEWSLSFPIPPVLPPWNKWIPRFGRYMKIADSSNSANERLLSRRTANSICSCGHILRNFNINMIRQDGTILA